ncbi:hypothetical protein RHS03_07962, partial [Rhizoctonia solani]
MNATNKPGDADHDRQVGCAYWLIASDPSEPILELVVSDHIMDQSPPPSYSSLSPKSPGTRAPSVISARSSSTGSNKSSTTSSSKASLVSKFKGLVGHRGSPPDYPSDPVYPSLFDDTAYIRASSAAMQDILADLMISVKNFQCPSKLDFSAGTENPMLLVNNQTNESFIGQLCNLNELRFQLSSVRTYGVVELIDMKERVQMSIDRVLQKMQERQLELHKQYMIGQMRDDAATVLETLHTSVRASAKRFWYPDDLDFLHEAKNTLAETGKNRRFIAQLDKINDFKAELNKVDVRGDPELEAQHKVVSTAIGECYQGLKAHQRKVYENSKLLVASIQSDRTLFSRSDPTNAKGGAMERQSTPSFDEFEIRIGEIYQVDVSDAHP